MRLVKLLLISVLLTLSLYSGANGLYKPKNNEYGKLVEQLNSLVELRDNTASLYHYHKRGLKYQKNGEYLKAIDNYKKAFKLAKSIYGINHHYTLQDANNLALCYDATGRKKEALHYNLIVLNIRKKISNKFDPNLGVAYANTAGVYSDLGKFNLAINYYKKAIEILIKSLGNNNFRVAGLYNNLSLTYEEIGNLKKAIYYNSKALNIAKKQNRLDALINITLGASLLNSSIGNFKKENKLRKNVINLVEQINNRYRKANYYNTIGLTYKNKGDYKEALKFYNKSYKLTKKIKLLNSTTLGANVLNNLSMLYSHLGNLDKALTLMKKAVLVYENIYGYKNSFTATAYSNLAGIYLDLKRYKKAYKLYKKALSIKESIFGKKSYKSANVYNNLGEYYKNIKDYKNALKYYQIALNIFKTKELEKENFNSAYEELKIGEVYLLQNKLKKANRYLLKALNIYTKKLGKNSYLEIDLYKNLSQINLKTKKYKKAYYYSKKALDIFIKNRDTLFSVLSSRDKKLFIKREKSIVSLYFNALFHYKNKKSVTEAYTRWMHIKNSVFNFDSMINQISLLTKDSNLKNSIKSYKLLKRELARTIENLPQKSSLARDKKIKILNSKIDKLSKSISAKVYKFKIYKHLKQSRASTLADRLKDSDIFIDYAYINKSYYYFTITKAQDIHLFKFDNNTTNEINKEILLFRKRIRGNENLLNESKKLYNLIVSKNLEKDISNKSNLILSLDGILKLFPIEALYKNSYLIEDKNIFYTTNAIDFLKSDLNSFKAKKQAVIFANPNFESDKIAKNRGIQTDNFYLSSTFDKLNYSQEEAIAIKNILKAYMQVKVYLGNQATEENLFKVKNPKILHLSTHGFFLNSSDILNPMLKSGIVLSGANKSIKNAKDYGILTALKLSGLNLNGTELVTLSACDTAKIDIKDTNSLSALFKAFSFAGARRVLLTLWAIKDKETKDFMQIFYKNSVLYKNYPKALKMTKLEIIKKGYSPLYWAGFILYGQ